MLLFFFQKKNEIERKYLNYRHENVSCLEEKSKILITTNVGFIKQTDKQNIAKKIFFLFSEIKGLSSYIRLKWNIIKEIVCFFLLPFFVIIHMHMQHALCDLYVLLDLYNIFLLFTFLVTLSWIFWWIFPFYFIHVVSSMWDHSPSNCYLVLNRHVDYWRKTIQFLGNQFLEHHSLNSSQIIRSIQLNKLLGWLNK